MSKSDWAGSPSDLKAATSFHFCKNFVLLCRYGDCEDGYTKTPALWIATRGGAIPYLTAETFEISGLKSQKDMFAGLLVPFKDHARSVAVYEKFEKG
jgi:hypothetical protein